MATTLLLATATPVALAQEDADETQLDALWRCVPSEDRDAQRIPVAGDLYYRREMGGTLYKIEEIWQETNKEDGLQLNSGMSCVGKPDRFVRAACIGVCPFTF